VCCDRAAVPVARGSSALVPPDPGARADIGGDGSIAAVDSDRALLEAWRSGDTEAGSALFERHFPAVYRFFCNKVGTDIDDLVQQTFLGCVEGASRFRAHASFRTFLFAVARNKLHDHLRRAHAGGPDRSADFGVTSLHDLGVSPPDVIATREEERLLLRALRRLSVEQQTLVELSYWEGLTDAALAEVVGIPKGTLKSRLRKARQDLEAELAALSRSPELLQSTVGDLEGWAAAIRDRASSPR
jgi:RNA polymerase sigma factor (sigma-70 family)